MTEVSGLENEKILKPEELSGLKLPTELLSYLSESNRYRSKLYESILKDIEDLYLYYTSLYSFSSIEFTELALRALDRANNAEKFFFYGRRIFQESLEITPKEDTDTFFRISRSKVDLLIEEAVRSHF